MALVQFACSMDFKCVTNTDYEMIINAKFNSDVEESHTFKIYRIMEFDSDRKRMSILLRDPTDDKIKLYIKGADSIILSRIDKN